MAQKTNTKKSSTRSKKSAQPSLIAKYSRPASVVAMVAVVGTAMIVSSFAASPSGQDMPVGDLKDFKQIFAEDFTVNAPLGSMGSDYDASKVVYTGANGTKWVTYPKSYHDTYQKRPYRSDQVLSVHDGVMDFWLRNVDGQPAGANPSPVIDGTSQYQTYGRYSARIKVDNKTMSEYYTAWLLWPQNEAAWQCAESDFPEGQLSSTNVSAFAHYGCNGSQDHYSAAVDLTQWHTFTQEWLPGKRNFYVDNTLIGSSTNQVYDQPQRWQLQTETNGNGNSSGHLLVDWVVVYKYAPGTVASTTTAATTTPSAPTTPTTTPDPIAPATPAPVGDTTAPSAPAGLKISNVKDTSVDLSWAASTDNVGVSSYDIYRNGAYIDWSPPSKTSYTITGLTCGTSYTTKVVALDAARNYATSSSLAFTSAACPAGTASTPPPVEPTPPVTTPTPTNPTPTTKPTPATPSASGSGTVTPVILVPAAGDPTPPPQLVTGVVTIPTLPTTGGAVIVKVDNKPIKVVGGQINTKHLDNGDHTVTVQTGKKGTPTHKAVIRVQNNLSWWEKIRNFFRSK